MHIAKEIVGDFCNGDVIDIKFIALNEEQEQVKWTLKSFDLNIVCQLHKLLLEVQRYHYGQTARQGLSAADTNS